MINLNSKIIMIGQENDAANVSDVKIFNGVVSKQGSNLKVSSWNYMVELYSRSLKLTMFLFKGTVT